jgi:hypothetical protein
VVAVHALRVVVQQLECQRRQRRPGPCHAHDGRTRRQPWHHRERPVDLLDRRGAIGSPALEQAHRSDGQRGPEARRAIEVDGHLGGSAADVHDREWATSSSEVAPRGAKGQLGLPAAIDDLRRQPALLAHQFEEGRAVLGVAGRAGGDTGYLGGVAHSRRGGLLGIGAEHPQRGLDSLVAEALRLIDAPPQPRDLGALHQRPQPGVGALGHGEQDGVGSHVDGRQDFPWLTAPPLACERRHLPYLAVILPLRRDPRPAWRSRRRA